MSGAKIVAVSRSSGGVFAENGLDVSALKAYADNNRSLAGFPQAKPISNAEILTLPCDVLVLAAMENQITEENAHEIQANIIAEAANGPITLSASKILEDGGATVLPDILANAGGVVVSYLEWVQGLSYLFWDEEKVNQELERIIVNAYRKVIHLSKERGISLRLASYTLGIDRVAKALVDRGLYSQENT
ncbi:NAD-specific glutamate dehydrogenase [Richelia intracellularis HM01]|nr:NAD-specific glutamate dehydrogenase [Richelia intracellularis HM01]